MKRTVYSVLEKISEGFLLAKVVENGESLAVVTNVHVNEGSLIYNNGYLFAPNLDYRIKDGKLYCFKDGHLFLGGDILQVVD